MTWNRALLLIVVALAAAIAYWHFSGPKAPRLALQFLDKQLACVDKANRPVGSIKIASHDDGATLSVITDDGSYALNDAGGEDSYRNGEGQTLAFGEDVSFSGFFDHKTGHCS